MLSFSVVCARSVVHRQLIVIFPLWSSAEETDLRQVAGHWSGSKNRVVGNKGGREERRGGGGGARGGGGGGRQTDRPTAREERRRRN